MSNNPGVTIPTVKRRLISMVYESLLGLAVLFLPLLILEVAMNGSIGKTAWHARQALVFLVLGAYFIHQWSRNGQTLAMQTWRLKVVRPGHQHLSLQAAAARYLLSWMWVLPAAIVGAIFGLKHWPMMGALGAGILLWSLTALLDKDRQFLHDKLAGTRLIQLPPPEKKKKAEKTV
jgi:uncharacterized RDD family membrane protein YckC